MIRILTASILGLSLLLSPVSSSTFAEQAQQSASEEKTAQLAAPTWTLDQDVWKAGLGPNQPEIAVLRLPDSDYQDFSHNPKLYLEDRRVFAAKLNAADPCYVKPHPGGHEWVLILVHTPDSTVRFVAWQLEDKQLHWYLMGKDKWRTDLGQGEPEIAIERVNDSQFKELIKNPKDYFEDHRIFHHKLNRFVNCTVPVPKGDPVRYMIYVHTVDSTHAALGY
jgi:hypothetical protein